MAATPATGSTAFNKNSPRTQISWSKRFFKFMLQNTILSTLMSTDQNSPIAEVFDLTNRKGGSIVFEMDAPLIGQGITDYDRFIHVDGSNTFNTEALKVYNYTIEVHRRGHSVQAAGLLSNQYTNTNVKTTGLRQLGVWMGETLENDLIAAGSGVGNVEQDGSTYTSQAGTAIETVNQANPTQNRYYAIGASSAGVISYCKIDGTSTNDVTGVANLPLNSFTNDDNPSGDTGTAIASRFNTAVIEFLRRKAREVITGSYGGVTLKIPKLAPMKINGRDKYTMIISRLQEKSLKADPKWLDTQQLAGMRGETNNLFTGAIGEWDGVIIKVSERAQYRIGAGGETATEYFNDFSGSDPDNIHESSAVGVRVDRGLFLGTNAIVLGYAMTPKKHTSKEDIGTLDTVGVDAIYGTGAVKFNYYNTTDWQTPTSTNVGTEQYGVIVFDTIVDPD